jgi:hypothetical protein
LIGKGMEGSNMEGKRERECVCVCVYLSALPYHAKKAKPTKKNMCVCLKEYEREKFSMS